jgi:hypothetical protein
MTIAEVARHDYVKARFRMDDKALKMSDAMPLTKRLVRNYAAIAWRAAEAEIVDPEPVPYPCIYCGGIRVCDWSEHAKRFQ